MPQNKTVSCPCCGNQHPVLIGKLPDISFFAGQRLNKKFPGGQLYSCGICNMKFRHPTLPKEKYFSLYDNSLTTVWPSDIYRNDWKLILDYVHKNLSPGGKILDFGCYNGGLLKQLDYRYKKFGIEINKSAALIAAEQNSATVWQSIDTVPVALKFDIIVATDIIEHVENPALFIEQLMKKLNKDGTLLITTGDAENKLWKFFGSNWWYCFYGEHIAFISKPWLDYFSLVHNKEIAHVENFKYFNLTKDRLLISWIMTILYGITPIFYLKAHQLINNIINSNSGGSPRSAGISPDHLFIALRHKRSLNDFL